MWRKVMLAVLLTWIVVGHFVGFSITATEVSLAVPLFSQNDWRWCNDRLGNCQDTYLGYPNPANDVQKAGGCAVTALAMVCNYYHQNFTDPGNLNIALRNKGGYAGGCDLWWSKLNSIGVLPPEMEWRDYVGPEKQSNFDSIIDNELRASNPVIACVEYTTRSGQRNVHFVVIVGKKGNEYLINDPWGGVRTTLSRSPAFGNYPYSVRSLVLFRRKVAVPQYIVQSLTATMLVIDVSGSMAWQWKGGIKLESAKKAALQFIEQVTNEPRPAGVSHMIGVVTFSSDASLNCPLTENYEVAKQTIIQLGTISSTNLGAGLVTALKELEKLPTSAQKFIILLSDGMTNTGMSRSEILSGPVREARARGICIHTIGFGDPGDIDEEFLRQIASGSGCGSYNYASSGFELFGTYVKVRHRMLGSNYVVEFSSRTAKGTKVFVLPGQSIALGAFQLTSAAKELHYTLVWEESGRLVAKLVDPTGREVTTGYPGAQIYSGQGFSHITVFSPKPGIWRVAATVVSSFPQGVQYYGVVSARSGGIVIPYESPKICLYKDICIPLPDLPTFILVAISVIGVGILLWQQLFGG